MLTSKNKLLQCSWACCREILRNARSNPQRNDGEGGGTQDLHHSANSCGEIQFGEYQGIAAQSRHACTNAEALAEDSVALITA